MNQGEADVESDGNVMGVNSEEGWGCQQSSDSCVIESGTAMLFRTQSRARFPA